MAKVSMPLYFKDKEEKERFIRMHKDRFSRMSFNGMFIDIALPVLEKWEKEQEKGNK